MKAVIFRTIDLVTEVESPFLLKYYQLVFVIYLSEDLRLQDLYLIQDRTVCSAHKSSNANVPSCINFKDRWVKYDPLP